MYGILNVSKSGMSSTQNKINVISNNIVNSNTAGYKKLDVEFQDLVRAGLSNNSYPTNDVNATTGTGIKSTTEVRNFTQGSLKNTKISTNLAIDGEGLFRVIRSDNTYAYTRNGEFSVDANGTLVDDAGNILDIQGEVFVNDEKIGNINLYKPTGDNDVLSASGNLFIANDGVELIAADGDIYQGYTEMSNVDISQEFTDLIAMQRAFQLNSKGFTVADEMWSMINNLQSR